MIGIGWSNNVLAFSLIHDKSWDDYLGFASGCVVTPPVKSPSRTHVCDEKVDRHRQRDDRFRGDLTLSPQYYYLFC
jgi:hypothetical protein